VREERVRLEDRVDVALVRRQSCDVAVADQELALVWLLEARDQAQRRRLAAAGRAEQGQELAAADRQVEPVDGHDVIEAFRHGAQLDVGLGAHQ
jgi:hypothetical protein